MNSNNSRGVGIYGIDHNPGYDFIRLLSWLTETDPEDPNLPFASYLIPVITLLSGCCAIEAYVNMVGQKIDKDWQEFDKGHVAIKERIKHIYEILGRKADFSQYPLQATLNLFNMRNDLVHPRYSKKQEQREDHIPDLFEILTTHFPPVNSQQIANDTIDLMLQESNLKNLKDHWRSKSYEGKSK